MDAAEWLNAYNQCSDDVRTASTEVRERDQLGAQQSAKDRRALVRRVTSIHETLKRLTSSLEDMEARPAAFKITDGELNRRRGLLSRLKSSVQQLDDAMEGKSRGDLLRGQRKAKTFEDTEETRGLDNRALLDQQQATIARQDDQLDAVLAGVSKLKTMGHDINQELDMQTALLDDLHDSVDNTDVRIQSNTRRVTDVQEKEASCVPLCIIFLLLGVIVGLLVWG